MSGSENVVLKTGRMPAFDHSEAGSDVRDVPQCGVTFDKLLDLFESASFSIKED